jgi:hypothetical protein
MSSASASRSMPRATPYRLDREGFLPPPAKDFGSRRWVREEIIEAFKNVKRMTSEESDD